MIGRALVMAAVMLAAISAEAAEAPATKLSLRETASTRVAADLFSATLRAEARGDDAGAIQADVNKTMAHALEVARAAGTLKISTGSYFVQPVWQPDARSPSWTASQSITLSAKEVTTVLQVAGTLQQSGLMMADMHGELSPDLRATTETRLMRDAIARVRAEADAAAEAMGLRCTGFTSVRIEKEQQGMPIRPLPRAMAVASASIAAPVAEPADQQVSVTAEAEAILQR